MCPACSGLQPVRVWLDLAIWRATLRCFRVMAPGNTCAMDLAWGFALLCESLSFACPNESNQKKDTLSARRCYASMPCAARRAGRSRNSLRSDSRLLHPVSTPLLGAPQGNPIQRGAAIRRCTRYAWKMGLYYLPSEATETRSGGGCPAHCAGAASLSERRQSDASSGRIPSPRASEWTGKAGADAGAFCFGYFYLGKQIKVARASARNPRAIEGSVACYRLRWS